MATRQDTMNFQIPVARWVIMLEVCSCSNLYSKSEYFTEVVSYTWNSEQAHYKYAAGS